jgi:N-acyl-D-aspartate/D-glutamate deacylase
VLDLVIRGADVVDGTGRPRRRADVGIRGGRIAAVGRVDDPTRHTVDAGGLVVTPGFVDIHSHFDAQALWDPALTPSCFHGVTTTVSGNCGFSIAPLGHGGSEADYIMRMLARVEGMPLESLRASGPWDWSTTAEYFDRLRGQLAINLGVMVGHSAIRRLAMGDAATERASTPAELEVMKAALRLGLEAGGLGLSSSWGPVHDDGDGRPVPSRFAAREELVALAEVCGEFAGTSVEFMPPDPEHWTPDQCDLMCTLSTVARRPVNWNLMRVTESTRARAEELLRTGTEAAARGGQVVALMMPMPSGARYSLRTGFVLDMLPGWGPVLALGLEDRMAALRDPEVRRRLTAESAPGGLSDWGAKVVCEVVAEANRPYVGRLVRDIAAEKGTTPLDALLDIAGRDELRTTFVQARPDLSDADWSAMRDVWRDGRAVIGGSDAGAHLDFTAYFGYPVYLIEMAVRRWNVVELEEAVHQLTSVPARLYGLVDRGVVATGACADLVLLDEAAVASGPLETRFDLPAGAGRLYGEPSGIEQVVVNGEVLVERGRLTDARPGQVLISGRDTAGTELAAPISGASRGGAPKEVRLI